MSEIGQAFIRAAHLLLSGDRAVWEIALRSLWVSGLGVLVGSALGLPVGAWVGLKSFPGKRIVVTLLNVGMALPPVVVGLVVYLLLSRSGPLGVLGLLFTPTAMVIAQTILAAPVIAALTTSAVMSVDPAVAQTAKALGAAGAQVTVTVLREARFALGAAIIAGFGAVISEVGAVMMVGGNIAGSTRVMTTAIMLETAKGNFELAMALGIILLLLTFVVYLGLNFLQQGRQRA